MHKSISRYSQTVTRVTMALTVRDARCKAEPAMLMSLHDGQDENICKAGNQGYDGRDARGPH